MESVNLILFICLLIPMSMMMLIFKGHSRMLCACLLTGMFMCVFSGEINGFFANICQLDMQTVAVDIAPLVEELAKALPVVFVAFLLRPSKQELAEYALAIGVGFATLENVCVLIDAGSISFGYALLRALGAGMMHGICTLIVGLAMSTVITRKTVFFSGTMAALSIAVIYHSIYNMMISSRYMVIGSLVPLVTFAAIVTVSVIGNKKRLENAKKP